MKNYKLTIPKPCHENWDAMTPNEKGKFCSSCSKTVVDFTKKSTKEIQEYLIANKEQRVCGHFYRKQLDSIVIQLPETMFHQSLTFQKLFIISLLFAMGTTLFSCKTDSGKIQKIEKVEIIDSIAKTEIGIDILKKNHDTLIQKNNCKVPPLLATTEITVIENTGKVLKNPVEPFDIEEVNKLPKKKEIEEAILLQPKDSVPEVVIVGVIVEGEAAMEPIEPYSFFQVDSKPKFKKTTSEFEEELNKFIRERFSNDLFKDLGIKKGNTRMYTQFTIDSLGNVSDVKVRAAHPKLKECIKEIIHELPQFIPAKKEGKNVSVKCTLPIIFEVD
ncbi:energy transducer TonB [Tenacibaculum tangerinum]|uniref:Energy transducer TonB n=1 Tax=Tenacibaculum tangerinum TaxID=3038772 RepID=A0ABY8KZ55_9FLAO|nr:energy transducer TonB [Tenacibaculum tangerinum]WGH74499.1 energy transducer TonB [Tenacibaculum tangerinum]